MKAPQLTIPDATSLDTKNEKDITTLTIGRLAEILRERKAKSDQSPEQDGVGKPVAPEPHPEKPWGEDKQKKAKVIEELLDEDDDNEPGPQPEDTTDPPPPVPKTYSLLLKITQLTQHYLSSSSPSLRTSLIGLISTTIPALAKHENSYLPLVNTLWPELVSRLQDDEIYIVSGSLEVIAIMSEHAGTFMRTRISSLWPELQAVHSRLLGSFREATSKSSRKESRQMVPTHLDPSVVGYVDTSTKTLWMSLQRLLLVCVRHGLVDAVMFDDVLKMLRPLSKLGVEARLVLERENADAVWLATLKENPRLLQRPLAIAGQSRQFAQAVF